ncbi:MAG: MCE family protein [Deltaproteobacteria bacterium]|nr:MAG: MCE family protein [Deltaproteobacteria bacterium]
MSAPTNRWKLGAFVVGSVVIGVAAAIVLTAETMRVASVTYTSYFDEAVTGLEVGSPVRYRGVKIGNVSAIDVAPDQRHVEIVYSLGVKVLSKLRLAGTSHGKETRILLPPDLRVQLAITGLTGTKFLQIDFFDTAGEPPVLPFPVPENYIPATASTMKNLEEAVVRAVGMMPHIAQQLDLALSRTNAILDDLDRRGLPGKASTSLDNANQLLATLQRKLSQVRVDDLSRDAAATLEDASATLVKMKGVLDHLDGNDGLFASVQRTSDSLNDVAGPRLGATFHETERDLREAAVAVRQLVEALQRDPDMFLKGKTKVRQ